MKQLNYFVGFFALIFSVIANSQNLQVDKSLYVGAVADNACLVAESGDISTALAILLDLADKPEYADDPQIEAAMRKILNEYNTYGYHSISRLESYEGMFSKDQVISNDGKYIYMNSGNGVEVWNVETRKCEREIKMIDRESTMNTYMKLSSDDKSLIWSNFRICVLVDLKTEKVVKEFNCGIINSLLPQKSMGRFNCLEANNTGDLVTLIQSQYLAVYDFKSEKILYVKDVNADSKSKLCISPDNNKIALIKNHIVELYDLATGELLRSEITEKSVELFTFNYDGSNYLISTRDGYCVYDTEGGNKIKEGRTPIIGCVRCIDANRLIQLTSQDISILENVWNKDEIVWSVFSQTLDARWVNHISLNGRYCVYEADKKDSMGPYVLNVMQLSDGVDAIEEFNKDGKGNWWRGVCYNNEQSKVLAYKMPYINFSFAMKPEEYEKRRQRCRELYLFDATTGDSLTVLSGHKLQVTYAEFSPDDNAIVSASLDNTIKIWDVATATCKITLQGHNGEVNVAKYNPAGDKIVSAAKDSTIKIWDAITGKELMSVNVGTNVFQLAFSPNGQTLFTVEDGKVRERFVATGKLRRNVLESLSYAVRRVLISENGCWAIAFINQPRDWNEEKIDYAEVQVWDIEKDELKGTISYNWINNFTECEISDDGELLMISQGQTSRYQHIMLFDVKSGVMLDQIGYGSMFPCFDFSKDKEDILLGFYSIDRWTIHPMSELKEICRKIVGSRQLSFQEQRKYHLTM